MNELPKEKRPPDSILWEGTPEDLEDWLEKVMKSPTDKNNNRTDIIELELKDTET